MKYITHPDYVYSKGIKIRYNSKQTLMNNAVNNKALRNLFTVLSSVKLSIPAGNLWTCRAGAMPEQQQSNTPSTLKQHSLVDSFCCSSFRNTNNVTGTSKACGSLKWESLASLCLTHCASFKRMNRSL